MYVHMYIMYVCSGQMDESLLLFLMKQGTMNHILLKTLCGLSWGNLPSEALMNLGCRTAFLI
jgi:hypothetical protein